MSISLLNASETKRLTEFDVARIEAAWNKAWADETNRVYGLYWDGFVDWCAAKGRGFSPLPAAPVAVAGYLSELGEAWSWSAVQLANASIRKHHEERGFQSPTRDPRLATVRKGIRNADDHDVKQAAPLTLERFLILESRVWRRLPRETGEEAELRAATDIAIIALMRDCLLRRLECSEATWADLEKLPDGTGALHIHRRKQRKRRSKAPVYVSLHTMVYLLRMLHLRGGPAPELSDRIFGIGGRQISNRIKRAAEMAELPGEYRGHSPRVGMLHDLAMDNAEMPSLMQAGGWSSGQSVLGYIGTIMASKSVVAAWYKLRESQADGRCEPSRLRGVV